MDPIIGSIIGSAITGGTSLGNGLFGYFSTKATNKANKKLAEIAYQQNVEQWERENAYNHPAQQMARLKEAGLNPNLVYGNGSAVQTSARSPQLNYPNMQTPNLQLDFSGVLDVIQKVKNIEQTQAITDNYRQTTANLVIDGLLKEIEKSIKGKEDLYMEDYLALRNFLTNSQGLYYGDMSSLLGEQIVSERKKQDLLDIDKSSKQFDLDVKKDYTSTDKFFSYLEPFIGPFALLLQEMMRNYNKKKGKNK